MIIRKNEEKDIESILSLFNMARKYFKDNNINQWQGPYPDRIDIIEDIKVGISYVVEMDEVVGTFVLSFEEDPNYITLVKGQWLNDNPYGVIHRVVVRNDLKGSGIGSFIFNECKNICLYNNIHDIRVDTHDDNSSMKSLILKNGFVYCGITTVKDKTLRNIYQLSF